MNPLISVIVPIYKVESYLDKCVGSIVNQTYKNLEIILVDDGSPDNCPVMCDGWAEKDNRIKVIHKNNGGVSDARNLGIKVATGDYIAFVDSDDWLESCYYEVLVSITEKIDYDIVVCKYLKVYSTKDSCDVSKIGDTRVLDNHEAMEELVLGKDLWQVIVNKIYKRDLISDVLFEVGKRHEDDMWSYQIIGKAMKIAVIDYEGYFYYQRPDSFICNSYNLQRLDVLEAKAQRQKYIEERFPDLKTRAKLDLFGACIFACQSVMKFMSGEEKKKAKSIINNYVKEYKLNTNELSLLRGKSRLWFTFANSCFFMCCKIRSILGIGF